MFFCLTSLQISIFPQQPGYMRWHIRHASEFVCLVGNFHATYRLYAAYTCPTTFWSAPRHYNVHAHYGVSCSVRFITFGRALFLTCPITLHFGYVKSTGVNPSDDTSVGRIASGQFELGPELTFDNLRRRAHLLSPPGLNGRTKVCSNTTSPQLFFHNARPSDQKKGRFVFRLSQYILRLRRRNIVVSTREATPDRPIRRRDHRFPSVAIYFAFA